MALAAQKTQPDPIDSVTAELVYLANLDIPPVIHYENPGNPVRDGNYGRFPTEICNMRQLATPSLDREGFEIVHHDTGVTDFYDAEAVERDYYAEIADLVTRATGANKSVVFDHTIRIEGGGHEESTIMRAPVRLVHNDYTEESGPKRVRDLLSPQEAEHWLGARFIEINVWRPIEGPVLVAPLAIIDARSMAPGDLTLANLIYPDRIGEIYHSLFNPDHRWFYAPEMTVDEAILIKGYDSARDGRARFTLHTAFDDPQTPKDPPPRKSIEARVLASFAD
ncbi:MAG: CmcJ/NvfI family oxidoreductase [Alphaproteobacteria bacterium]|nr:methyltransferase [Rhodospirillaceae bacterium]MDG2482781.1 CmcJ/NvfI family oxidoreductase [Alphaproteobacteria bacterium]MBT6202338.1 methyltransferase [Rhodospirillaceae bacterium]MBT6512531.1 methyltransferase [Rhodospirillaceae bacterium]MBT7614058.1 methyltransferase [Rhodospirillaceae bacterium]